MESSKEIHPLLKNLSVFTWMDIVESDEKCIPFLQDLGLIPRRTDAVSCPKCFGPMMALSGKKLKMGWRWTCKKRKDKITKCTGVMSPLQNTFFEVTRIPIREVVTVIFALIFRMSAAQLCEHLNYWRRQRQERKISSDTVGSFYERCRSVGAIVISKDTEKRLIPPQKILFNRYCKQRLTVLKTYGERVHQFLMDVKSVCPGYGKKGLLPKYLDSSESSSSDSDDNEGGGDNEMIDNELIDNEDFESMNNFE